MRFSSLASIWLLGAACFVSACTNKAELELATDGAPLKDTVYKRYAIKQAHIHYEASGFRRGTEDLYFTDWGRKEARYSNTETLSPDAVRPQHMITITKGSRMTIADLTMNAGHYRDQPFIDSLFRLSKVESAEVISDNFLRSIKYTKQGTDTLLGKTVDVWSEPTSGTTLYLWNAVVLKQVVQTPEHHHIVLAQFIDTSSAIPDSIFTPPASLEYVEDTQKMPGPGGPR